MKSINGINWKESDIPERLILKNKQKYNLSYLLSKIFLVKNYSDEEIHNSIYKIQQKEIIYKEGCLSIPNKMITTKRYERIEVEADNVEGTMIFGPEKDNQVDNDLLILEAVCVQHEIDHLNGKTIYDREFKRESFRRTEIKIGRNEKVTIKNVSTGETKEMKFKQAEKLIQSGSWIIT